MIDHNVENAADTRGRDSPLLAAVEPTVATITAVRAARSTADSASDAARRLVACAATRRGRVVEVRAATVGVLMASMGVGGIVGVSPIAG